MKTGLVLDERYTHHDTGQGHPERSQRIEVLLSSIGEPAGVKRLSPRPATPDEIVLVHAESHFDAVAGTRGVSRAAFDADTPVSAESFDTACLAAGGLLTIIDEVMEGSLENGFAMVRPPGHHAERGRAMGFCLFNNVAVGAAHLRHRYGLERILVMDWDVHHGNGTQHSFYGDPGVLYVSTHRYPFYPGTGGIDEVGAGEGTGYTVNIPFPGGFGDAEYADAFEAIVAPVAELYEPQFVLISAGFDPHARDPLGGMRVTEAGFAGMARSLLDVAGRCSQGRCVAVLEGGYDLTAIRDSSAAVLAQLMDAGRIGSDIPDRGGPPSRAAPVIEAVRRKYREYWRI
jgi:acetoin utilization deacetylase AcuC-like enzyme